MLEHTRAYSKESSLRGESGTSPTQVFLLEWAFGLLPVVVVFVFEGDGGAVVFFHQLGGYVVEVVGGSFYPDEGWVALASVVVDVGVFDVGIGLEDEVDGLGAGF